MFLWNVSEHGLPWLRHEASPKSRPTRQPRSFSLKVLFPSISEDSRWKVTASSRDISAVKKKRVGAHSDNFISIGLALIVPLFMRVKLHVSLSWADHYNGNKVA